MSENSGKDIEDERENHRKKILFNSLSLEETLTHEDESSSIDENRIQVGVQDTLFTQQQDPDEDDSDTGSDEDNLGEANGKESTENSRKDRNFVIPKPFSVLEVLEELKNRQKIVEEEKNRQHEQKKPQYTRKLANTNKQCQNLRENSVNYEKTGGDESSSAIFSLMGEERNCESRQVQDEGCFYDCGINTKSDPCLSILNLVVDYVMRPPCPLEPYEFQLCPPPNIPMVSSVNDDGDKSESIPDERQNILVPVLRIFGPVLKHNKNSSSLPNEQEQPRYQSGCVHIHNAFPYMLARPNFDSVEESTGNNDNSKAISIIDWGDMNSIIPHINDIAQCIEDTLMNSLQYGHNNNQQNNDDNSHSSNKRSRFIRQVTIVYGRGFYTYSSGPPVPFLKIEYYDPRERWRIKACLEKGFEMPFLQPENDVIEREDMVSDTVSFLSFRCYEAHIPYTMQIFKDWNLSGMTYVDIREVRFRSPTPIRPGGRKWTWEKSTDASTSKKEDSIDNNSQFFLRSNIPLSHCWENDNSIKQTTASRTSSDYWWTKKETSCEIEMDTSVTETLNVLRVLTPENIKEQESSEDICHWRAVPSLKEIWEEERARMKELLPPEHDFLNKVGGSDEEDKKKESLPGASHASKGMKSLFEMNHDNSTSSAQAQDKAPFDEHQEEGEWGNYRRALRDILKRHDSNIETEDLHIKKTHKKYYDAIKNENEQNCSQELSAFDSLINQFGSQRSTNTPSQLSQSSQHSQQTHNNKSVHLTQCSLSSVMRRKTSVYSGTPKNNKRIIQLSQIPPVGDSATKSFLFTQQDYEYGMSVDQGNTIEDSGDTARTIGINPSTLMPYDSDNDVSVDSTTSSKEKYGRRQRKDSTDEETPIEKELELLTTQMEAAENEIDSSDNIGRDHIENDENEEAILTNAEENGIEEILTQHEIQSDTNENAIDRTTHESLSPLYRQNHRQSPQQSDCDITIKGLPFLSYNNRQEDSGLTIFQSQKSSSLPIMYSEEKRSSLSQSPNIQQPSQDSETKGTVYLSQKHDQKQEEVNKKQQNFVLPWLKNEGESCASPKFPLVSREWLWFEPVKKPPSLQNVISWCEKEQTKQSTRRVDRSHEKQRKRPKKSTHLGNHTQNTTYNNDSEKARTGVQLLKLASPASRKKVTFHHDSTPTKEKLSQCSDERYTLSQNSKSPLSHDGSSNSDVLGDMGNTGGRLYMAGGGNLKAKATTANQSNDKTRFTQTNSNEKMNNKSPITSTPLTIMSVEIHVQCRFGKSSLMIGSSASGNIFDRKKNSSSSSHDNSNMISMKPDPSRDSIYAIIYVLGIDPGKGEPFKFHEMGCIHRPVQAELEKKKTETGPSGLPEVKSNIKVKKFEEVKTERDLLLRFSSIVQWRDPDAIVSWDTIGSGIGYIIERGLKLNNNTYNIENDTTMPNQIDMVKLLGRTPKLKYLHYNEDDSSFDLNESNINTKGQKEEKKKDGSQSQGGKYPSSWRGSGLGIEWDERVGAGLASSSIIGRMVFSGWKILAEEVKHPNVSDQSTVVAAVLKKRMPFHDDKLLTQWYGSSRTRHRVLKHRLNQAKATLLLFDSLDIIGRAGESARLSGVELYQSMPGIRGSQYKVEGVLLRALKSVWSTERGRKKGRQMSFSSSPYSLSEPDYSLSPSIFSNKTTQSQSPWKLRRNRADHFHTTASTAANKFFSDENVSLTQDTFDNDNHELHSCKNDALKDQGYFFYSPSQSDCQKQEALECQALTLEPESGFHFDPVVVCDFTALYPSLVIAYNLCYATISGKLNYHSTRKEMRIEGCTTGKLGPLKYSEYETATTLKHHMKSLSSKASSPNKSHRTDRAYVAPTGSIFISEAVLKGVLPQVLDEMLATRAMLKRASKIYRQHVKNLSPSIIRQLEARQLALKYVANVTYGYTSATFSGRSAMPLLADTIVECGRRTLLNAIRLANSWGEEESGKWSGAHVIYGDTDSLFIKLPGRTIKEAFAFGKEFVKAVTKRNPPPVQLKLEKVYAATLLQTKKRYCGMMFESPDSKQAKFEAKGLETIRKDQCTLTQRIVQNALITLFKHGKAALREYLIKQWGLIHAGKLPVSDFILTGRVRSQYRGNSGPVQAALVKRLSEADPGYTIRHKERVPYVIVASPGRIFKLRDFVLTPLELMEQWDSYTIHTAYYIYKHLNAALQRCFGLAPYNLSINKWYESCPKPRRRIHHWPTTKKGGNSMIYNYFGTDICSICNTKCKAKGNSKAVVCQSCMKDYSGVLSYALKSFNEIEHNQNHLSEICKACNGCQDESAASFAVEKTTKSELSIKMKKLLVLMLALSTWPSNLTAFIIRPSSGSNSFSWKLQQYTSDRDLSFIPPPGSRKAPQGGDTAYIRENILRQLDHYMAIRKVGGVDVVNDLYVRDSGSEIFWYVGKLAKCGTVTLEQAVQRQWNLIEEHAARLRPVELGRKFGSGSLEIWSAPGDTERHIEANVANIDMEKISPGLVTEENVKKIEVGLNLEVVTNHGKGFCVTRSNDGKPIFPDEDEDEEEDIVDE